MKKYALIVAGGSGSRMKSELPKQFLFLLGKPIIVYTIEKFIKSDVTINIVLVLPKIHLDIWQEIKLNFLPNTSINIVFGGNSRFQSVKNGLDSIIDSDCLVAIHDAVRPLVNIDTINLCFETAKLNGNASAAVMAKDTIREHTSLYSKQLDRSKLWLMQTPQIFNIKLIKKAFLQPESNLFTDDVSVFETLGLQVNLIESNYQNIKITTPEDLLIAEIFLKN